MGLKTEYIYTCKGRQRAVFLRPECACVSFNLELGEGDEGVIEVTYDPVETVRKGRGLWEPFEGGLAGSVACATAIRVNIGRIGGWVRLVTSEEQGTSNQGTEGLESGIRD